MHVLLEVYRRYFKQHSLGLLLAAVCCIGVAVEGAAGAWVSRYLIDEVLQVDKTFRLVRGGQPEAFVQDNTPFVGEFYGSDGIETLNDRGLPGEEAFVPVTPGQIEAEGDLENRIANKTGLSNTQKLRLVGFVAVLLVVIHILAVGAKTWADAKVGLVSERAIYMMRRHMQEKLLKLQMSFHDQNQTGRLLSRATDDINVIESHFSSVASQFTLFAGVIIINGSLMFYVNARLACLAFTALPFYFIAYNTFCTRIRNLHHVQRKEYASLYGLVRDRLANPRVVKGFGQEKREVREFFGRSKKLFRRNRRIVVLNNLLAMICTAISATVTAGTLAYGVILVQRGEMTLGYLLFFYSVCYALFWPLAALSQLTWVVQQLRIVCERVLQVLDEPIKIVDHARAIDLSTFSDAITFSNVTFTFDGTDRPAVSEIDLTIPKGSQVCLMGKSGAGKSTIGMLLLRLYDPTEGKITIDGSNLQKVKTSSLRKRISYVPQEPILFSGTLAGNILYGNAKADAEMMVNAAKAAEIDDFIAELPEGYQTMIGENGLRLSGGQKQRISLARALLTDPDILILDDCTSALDAETEAKIQKTFKNALAGKTVIMISHRVSAASNSDQIVVLEQGRIAERGTHEELVETKGTYWNLVKDQLEEQSSVALTRKKLSSTAAA